VWREQQHRSNSSSSSMISRHLRDVQKVRYCRATAIKVACQNDLCVIFSTFNHSNMCLCYSSLTSAAKPSPSKAPASTKTATATAKTAAAVASKTAATVAAA
jgi:hypothetical protein